MIDHIKLSKHQQLARKVSLFLNILLQSPSLLFNLELKDLFNLEF